MADIKVKYQPPVIEFFDVRVDCATMRLLIETLKVAHRELEVHEDVAQLIDALQAEYDKGPDGEPVDEDAATA